MRRFLILILLFVSVTVAFTAGAGSLVILHTNDTHSNIDPDDNGLGGVLQRKAIIDSVRKAEKNVLLVDAGDIVQGTLYFKYFGGDVEFPLMNMMGYDVQILGNHEFDNGIEELARQYKKLKADRLSANYDFSGTPLEGMFSPYTIRKIDGKKIGIIGLNVDPHSLISKQSIGGVSYRDAVEAANKTADFLKKEKECDLVVVVSHIGYTPDSPGKPTDVDVAEASRNIDVIIGGHSHTLVTPGREGRYPSLVKNSEGKDVLIAQTGKYGRNLGYIRIDLDSLADKGKYEYRLIPVTDRFSPEQYDKKMADFIRPYRAKVDSVNARVIAQSLFDLDSDNPNGGYANWTADFARNMGNRLLDSLRSANPGSSLPEKVDIGYMNVGGIRRSMPAGDVTEGQILSTFPFANRMVLMELKGSDFLEAIKIAAKKGGECISENVRVAVTPEREVYKVAVDGKELDPEALYIISTIDYLAEGNDDYESLANGRVIWTDPEEIVVRIMKYVEDNTRLGLPVAPDLNGRFVEMIPIPEN